ECVTHRRLRDAVTIRRCRDAARFENGIEDAEQIEIDAIGIHRNDSRDSLNKLFVWWTRSYSSRKPVIDAHGSRGMSMRASSQNYAAVVGTWISLSGAAVAQTNGPAQNEEGSFGVEQVTVTARRVQEDLQKTPVAITAFTPEALERKQIFRTDDLD